MFGIAVIGKYSRGLPPAATGSRMGKVRKTVRTDTLSRCPADGASENPHAAGRGAHGRVVAGKSDYWDAEPFEYIASDL
ncbi:MAG: hypothetical protein ACLT1W_11325 [Alistipes onderdonkii]